MRHADRLRQTVFTQRVQEFDVMYLGPEQAELHEQIFNLLGQSEISTGISHACRRDYAHCRRPTNPTAPNADRGAAGLGDEVAAASSAARQTLVFCNARLLPSGTVWRWLVIQ